VRGAICIATKLIHKNLEIPDRPRLHQRTPGGAKFRDCACRPMWRRPTGMSDMPRHGGTSKPASEANPTTSNVDTRRNLS
jgi:hypothetical protein